ncbi:MAG: serine/threonine protein kinase [Kofleriaceae bacterium]
MTHELHSSNDSAVEPGDFENTSPIHHGDTATDDDIVGERFGKYVLVGEIAIGGMAEVFLGVKKGLEGFLKVVVLKRVLPHFTDNAQFIRMFIDEARIAARLDHPNIVRTYEFGELDGQFFTVMEYLPGEDLRSVLRKLSTTRQWMPVHVAVGIVMQVCAGLHFAHELTDTSGNPLDLVHRDVNPANIILTYGGEVKIIDFGVAKTNTTATVTGTIKGKIAYMPPEQVLARGVDQRSDIFSAGVVLWESLTGRRLFGRPTDAATLYAIMNDPVAPPSRFRPDVPRELDAIVMRALSRDPDHRYHSAVEMSAALEQFMQSQPSYDTRIVAAMVEELFGTRRANAKRAISQTRSLGQNISLVMKLRTDVRTELAARLETFASGSTSDVVADRAPPDLRSQQRLLGGVAMVLAGIVGVLGIVYAAKGSSDESEARPSVSSPVRPERSALGSLLVATDPAGAAITVDGEPTGLETPATLTGYAAKHVTIRIERPGFTPIAESIDVPANGELAKHYALVPVSGRLVLADLPRGASVVVDGTEYQAGDVVDVLGGRHQVRVVVGERTIVQQQLETTAGFQRWKLAGDRLVAD